MHAITAWLAGGIAALSAIGIAQSIIGWIAVCWMADRVAMARRRRPRSADVPAVSVLKPLHGAEPLLEATLATVCRQRFPSFQVVLGVSDPADSALWIVRKLQAQFATVDLAVVVDARVHGANRKIGNLINMLPAAKHDVLVISDADVRVSRDWLSHAVVALGTPGVGLVTTVYTGRPATGSVLQKLGALQINQYFLPGALIARVMGRQDCLGATMMLRRETLDRIGGLPALADHLADDNVLGRLVQRLGLKVALADTIPSTTVSESTLAALWRHELRWARTIRALEPLAFAASVLQYPLAWSLLALLLAGGSFRFLLWFAVALGVRALTAHGVDRALAIRSALWLLPLRELMSVAVMAVSYVGRRVEWRGHTLQAEGFHPR